MQRKPSGFHLVVSEAEPKWKSEAFRYIF